MRRKAKRLSKLSKAKILGEASPDILGRFLLRFCSSTCCSKSVAAVTRNAVATIIGLGLSGSGFAAEKAVRKVQTVANEYHHNIASILSSFWIFQGGDSRPAKKRNCATRIALLYEKTQIVGISVAKCSKMSTLRGTCSPKIRCAIARCPELEIGRYSPRPCTIPRIKACHQFISEICAMPLLY